MYNVKITQKDIEASRRLTRHRQRTNRLVGRDCSPLTIAVSRLQGERYFQAGAMLRPCSIFSRKPGIALSQRAYRFQRKYWTNVFNRRHYTYMAPQAFRLQAGR